MGSTGDLALQGGVVVDASDARRARDCRHDARVVERPGAPGPERVLTRGGHNGSLVVFVVPNELDALQAEEDRDLIDDGRENLLWRGSGRDVSGDPSESGLLLAEAA